MAEPGLPDGAIDLYVHANPDLLPRRTDDLALAAELINGGVRAAVHRHHFSSTAERAILAKSAEPASPLLGAILCNDTVGGLNPAAVDLALRQGAVWVNLPTLSTASFRTRMGKRPNPFPDALGFGPGAIRYFDDRGALLPEIHEILELVVAHGAVLGLGYGNADEVAAAASEAGSRGVRAVVLTYPALAGLTPAAAGELAAEIGLWIELCAYGFAPEGPAAGNPDAVHAALALLRAAGVERTVLSSDGGMVGAPSPPALLAAGCRVLERTGVPPSDLVRLVVSNPARILGLE